MVNKKFEIRTPTIIWFFKSKLEYPHRVAHMDKPDPLECYKGFEDSMPEKVPVTTELIEMQVMLDTLARKAGFPAATLQPLEQTQQISSPEK